MSEANSAEILARVVEADPVSGLVFGCVLDGEGGCEMIDWAEAREWKPAHPGQTLWLHMDRTVSGVRDWLAGSISAVEATVEVLVSNETRPRAFRDGERLVTVLRGINFNEGAQPEDMIALQIWAEEQRVITFRRRVLQTPRIVLAKLLSGARGPRTVGDLLADLVAELVSRMNSSIVDMNARIDELEAIAGDEAAGKVLSEIAAIRRNCLALKRYMSPQHDALLQISRDAPDWLSDENRGQIRETIERLRRYLEDLDVSKESALVLQDDLNNRSANEMSRTMYMLSVVAAVFLPLTFVTGLLGINVGGMPGVNSGAAFWLTVVLLVILLGVEYVIFKRLKWL